MRTEQAVPARATTALIPVLLTGLLFSPAAGGAQAVTPDNPDAVIDVDARRGIRVTATKLPPEPWASRDTADALYRRARELMTAGEHRDAARIFGRIADEHPLSAYAPDALYWRAFNLYRLDDDGEALRGAVAALERQAEDFPDAPTRTNGEAAALATRIRGRLAARGDEDSARRVREAAQAGSCGEQDLEMRKAALNALVELGPAEALPMLRRIVRSDEGCNPELRAGVPYLLGRLESEEAVSLLLELASSTDEAQVEARKAAVHYLGDSDDPRALETIKRIVRQGPEELRGRALYALTRSEDPGASETLWEVIEDTTASEELRKSAVHYLGRSAGIEALPRLRALFERRPELRDRILYAVASMEGEAAMTWVLEVARDPSLDVDTRKSAIYQAGRRHDGLETFLALGDDLDAPELRRSFVYGLSERDDPRAVDALIHIVRTETDPEVRKSAIYWLGRSEDPRAAEVLREIIG